MSLSFIKLDINIMNDTKIKLIRKMPEGSKLFELWIGILCLGMKSGRPGVLEIGDGIPFNDETLSIELDLTLPIVRLGLETFERLKMIERFDNEEIYLTNFEKHQQLEEIERKNKLNRERVKKHRNKMKNVMITDENVMITDKTDKTDKDVMITKALHNDLYLASDKDTDKTVMRTGTLRNALDLDSDKDIDKDTKKKKHKYGEYSHVLLTDIEYQKIQDKTGDIKKWIKILDEGIELKGYKYKSHYLAILKWYKKDNPDSTSTANKTCPDCGNIIAGPRCRCGWFE